MSNYHLTNQSKNAKTSNIMFQTRSQTIKNKEKIINEYELQLTEMKSSINIYEELISKIQFKLTEKEKLIKVLLDEQEENSNTFENMCRENQQLKKSLAEKESEVIDLQNEIINLNEFNCTLLEENEEIGTCNNLIITPLKMQMVEMQKENTCLQNKLAKNIKAVYNNNFNHPNAKNKHRGQKNKFAKILKDKNKQIRHLKRKCKTHYKKGKKKITIKEINHEETREDKYTINKANVINDELINQAKNNDINKITIIGDKSVRGMGIKLQTALGNEFKTCCHTYSNAPLEKIFDAAAKVLKKGEPKQLLAIFYKDFYTQDIKQYYNLLSNLIIEAKAKSIKLLLNNVPYSDKLLLNYNINKINNKLNMLALYENNTIDIINLSNLDITKKWEFKEILLYNVYCQCKKNFCPTNNHESIHKSNVNNVNFRTIESIVIVK